MKRYIVRFNRETQERIFFNYQDTILFFRKLHNDNEFVHVYLKKEGHRELEIINNSISLTKEREV